mgnify:CR=1 FL=1
MEAECYEHCPVLLREVIDGLNLSEGAWVVDCTFGRGGHSREILNKIGISGRLMALDRDPAAIASVPARQLMEDERFALYHGNFASLKEVLSQSGWMGRVDAVLMDLGVSSPQLDDPSRGFSFMREGPLDMRMNTTSGETAAVWLQNIGEAELTKVLRLFGEERYAGRIASAIVRQRQQAPLQNTRELASLIEGVVPRREPGKHPATRTFQAIRIVVNRELDELSVGLNHSVEALKSGGRLAVIAFHSLEDRIVKRFMRDHERGWSMGAGRPEFAKQGEKILHRLGKAVMPTSEEISRNPRARSAVLRISEKY